MGKNKLSEDEINAVIRGAILSECVEVIRVEMSGDVLERNGQRGKSD